MSKQLINAAEAGNLNKVSALLAAGADINWTSKSGAGRSALSEAALNGHADVVRWLAASGADLNWRDRGMGKTPLGWACSSGHLETVRVLIGAGSDLNLPTPKFLLSPLICAAISGHEDIVRSLLDAGADIHALTADGRNALVCAEKNRHVAVAALLKERGAVHPAPAEEVLLPWPDVGDDLALVDYSKAESVLRAFILSMNRWEIESSKQGDAVDWDKTRVEYAKAFSPYCTPKQRVYGRGGSFGFPPNYEPEEWLTSVTVKGARAELTTVQRRDRPARYENLYVLLKKDGKWLVDSKKNRCIGHKEWKNTIL